MLFTLASLVGNLIAGKLQSLGFSGLPRTVQRGQEVELGTPDGRSSQGATFRHYRYLRDGSHHLSHAAVYGAFLMSMAAMQ